MTITSIKVVSSVGMSAFSRVCRVGELTRAKRVSGVEASLAFTQSILFEAVWIVVRVHVYGC